MRRERVEQSLRYAIRIRVKKSQPGKFWNLREAREQSGEAVAQIQVFTVACRVLADESYFADAGAREIFGFAHVEIKSAATKCPSQLRNDAERARMIAALRDFDVRSVARRGQHARRQFVIQEIRRSSMRGAGRIRWRSADGFDASFHFAGAHDGVPFGNLREDFLAIAFHQTSGNNNPFG